MRIRSSATILLVGCNRLLGLGDVSSRDAAYYDAQVDAPFTCPEAGVIPSFDHSHVVQFRETSCLDFTASETGARALAGCSDLGVSGGAVMESNDGGPFVQAPGLEVVGYAQYISPRMGPDNTLATIIRETRYPDYTVTEEVLLVRRDATTWTPVTTIYAGSSPIATAVSQLTRGPQPHVLIALGQSELHEFVETSAGWQDRNTFTLPSFFSNEIEMSPDGLRMWWWRGQTDPLYYADRPTLNDPFVERGPLPGTDSFYTAFMAPDCGAIYFPSLQRIWKAPRI